MRILTRKYVNVLVLIICPFANFLNNVFNTLNKFTWTYFSRKNPIKLNHETIAGLLHLLDGRKRKIRARRSFQL